MRQWQEIMNTFSQNKISTPTEDIDKLTKPPPETEFCQFVNCFLSTPELNFTQSDEDDVLEYLLENITTGGAYARLWANVRRYCLKELPIHHFQQLDKSFSKAKGTNE